MRNDLTLKRALIVATYTVVLYCLLNNLPGVVGFLRGLISTMGPIIGGVGLAYVMNIIMTYFEERFFKFMIYFEKPWWPRWKRPISITCSFLSVVLFLLVLTGFIIPQLQQSVSMLISNIPLYQSSLERLLNSISTLYPETAVYIEQLTDNWDQVFNQVLAFLTSALPSLLTLTRQFTVGVMNLIMSTILSIYMLAHKEAHIKGLKKLIYAYIPQKSADHLMDVSVIANKTFSGFISGQVIEAIILGVLCFIGMSLMSMPYALLISMLVGITGLIPIIGAYLGIIPGAFIILIVDPPMAFWFVVFMVLLQNFEGNVIYPHVVGTSIGLGGFWVMASLLVGTSLFGVAGVLLSVPCFAVIYTLFRKHINKRLEEKEITI